MRTILKLKSKNKNEAIDALEKALEHLKENVEDDEVDIRLKVGKMTKVKKKLFLYLRKKVILI